MRVRSRSNRRLVISDHFAPPTLMIVVGLFFSAVALEGSSTLVDILKCLVFPNWPWVLLLLMTRIERLTFDRDSESFTRTCFSIRGRSDEVHPLRRVDEAHVAVDTGGDGDMFQIEIRLTNPDAVLPFMNYRTYSTRPKEIAQVVNDWLRLSS